MAYWSIGKIPLDREAIKSISSLFKPTFQYSNIPIGAKPLSSLFMVNSGVISG